MWKVWGEVEMRERNGLTVCLWAVPWLLLCNLAWWYRLLDTSEEPLTPEVFACIGGQGRGQDYENDPVETRFPASGKKKNPLEWFLSPLESHRKAYIRMKRKEVYLWMCEVELEVWWFEPRVAIKWRFFPPFFPPSVGQLEGKRRSS